MGDLIRWLLHDDQNDLFNYLFAVVLNVVFLGLAALLLWPLDRTAMVLELARGYLIFWIVLGLTGGLVYCVRRLLRVDIDSHFDAYVISALMVSGLIQAAWSPYAAITVDAFIPAASVWTSAILHGVGVLACYIAYVAVSAFYMGSLYRFVNLGVALLSYIVFAVWPATGQTIYFWASSRSISLTNFGSFGVTALS